MVKPVVKRSACDQCRAKRVQCLRPQSSTAPCARCSHVGARCVTSASGNPGRPRKSRQVVDGITPSPSSERHRISSTLREPSHADIRTAATAEELGLSKTPASASRTDRHASWDWLDGNAESQQDLTSTVHTPRDPLVDDLQAKDLCAPLGDSSVYFPPSSIEESPTWGGEMLALVDPLNRPSQSYQLLGASGDELSAMPHLHQDGSNSLDIDFDLLLDPWKDMFPAPTFLPLQFSSPATSLMKFREETEQRIRTLDAYYSDAFAIVQSCKDNGGRADQDSENPAAVLLTCSKEFVDIIQRLAPPLSTEMVLLALSSYLSLMRLFDGMFHTIHTFLSQLPREAYKSVKVKSALRIGGISSLQDMPLKMYATGILDAIQAQMRTLERCMGIPKEYCLSSEAAASAPVGVLSRADRAGLFWAVMAQDDVKSRRGSKSYVDSIRASIEESMRYLDD